MLQEVTPFAQAVWAQPIEKVASSPKSSVPDSAPSSEAAYWGRFNLPEAAALPVEEGDEEMCNVPIARATWDDRGVRQAFIRKVYCILSFQLFLTFGVCAFMTLHKSTQAYVLENGQGMFFFCIFLTFVLLCFLSCFKVRRSWALFLSNLLHLSVEAMKNKSLTFCSYALPANKRGTTPPT